MGVTEWVVRCVMSGMNTKSNTKIFYDDDYVLESELETRTKAKPIAELIISEGVSGVELRSPRKATRAELEEVHSPEYLDSLWNGLQDLLRSLLASTGGVLEAVDQALIDGFSGSLSSGLHHAKRTYEEGFCFINGLVIAALRALHIHKLTDIGILDLDAHCGGGTFELIGNDARVRLADVSTNSFDSWKSFELRHHLKIVRDANNYLNEVGKALKHLSGVQFLIYNAGMDPFEDCGIGGLPGITREVLQRREKLVADWCRENKVPALYVLAGGYAGPKLDLEGVARLHLLTINEFVQ
jgi:acetoin utilization deacetylase AcuC-like enzyme